MLGTLLTLVKKISKYIKNWRSYDEICQSCQDFWDDLYAYIYCKKGEDQKLLSEGTIAKKGNWRGGTFK